MLNQSLSISFLAFGLLGGSGITLEDIKALLIAG